MEPGDTATRWGSRDAVLVGTKLLALVYAVLVPVEAVALHGTARLVLVAMAAMTAAAFFAMGRVTLLASDRTVDAFQMAACLLPLVNALTHIALTGSLVQTTVVLLVVVGCGALVNNRRVAWSLVGTSCVTWGLVVAVTGPGPRGQLLFFVLQLGLACLLAGAVLESRMSAYRRLSRAISRSDLDLRRFRSVFDDSPVGIGLVDEDGLILEANAALCELFGRPARDVLGHSPDDFIPPDETSNHAVGGAMIDEAPGGTARLEKRYVRPDGDVRWAWLSMTRVSGPRGERWTLGHAQDVTERHRAEDELRLSRESMVAALEIAQATQQGRDPRPVSLGHLRRLAGASFVSLVEPSGEDRLVVTAVEGDHNLVGLTMSLHDQSMTTHVWNTGEAVFASRLADHPLVSRQLLSDSGAASLMWQPVGAQGEPLAVLSIAWDDPHAGVETSGRVAVQLIAAEVGAALVGEKMRRELEQSTVTDELTGLLNRRGWDREILRIAQQTERSGVPFTLAILDLDHFKRFNDSFGHLAGDDALRAFAHGAQATLRVVDVIARWGGEEFVVALNATNGVEARAALERLRTRVPDGLTCSVGFVEIGPHGDLETALAAADRALYQAKEQGRDRAVSAVLPRSEQIA